MSSLSLEPHLIEVEFYVELFSNTAPSAFHNVHFSSLRNEPDREISPPPSALHLHPVSPAQRGLKAVLTQQWFEWSVYTVGLCPLVTIQSPLMAYWLSVLIVAGIKVLSLFVTAGLQNLNVSQFCASSRHILASVTHGFSVTPQKTESSPSNPTRKNCASPRVTSARQRLQRPRSVWWVAIRCFCRKLLPWRWKPGPV